MNNWVIWSTVFIIIILGYDEGRIDKIQYTVKSLTISQSLNQAEIKELQERCK